jgi:hypothetical protein
MGFAMPSIDVANAPMDGSAQIPEGLRLVEIKDLPAAASATP